jgi:hypothetical protein
MFSRKRFSRLILLPVNTRSIVKHIDNVKNKKNIFFDLKYSEGKFSVFIIGLVLSDKNISRINIIYPKSGKIDGFENW